MILIRAAWKRCEQPPVARDEITEDEALAKLEDVYERYEAGQSEEYQKQTHGEEVAAGTFDSLVAKEAAKIRIREPARELVDASKRPPLDPFDAGTLGEILTRPPQPKARIADLVPWEAGTLITAQRKVGKTTFVGNLCRSLINGGPFLGCFEVRPVDGEIAILNFEMPALQLAPWLDSMQIPRSRLYLINLRAPANPLASERDRARSLHCCAPAAPRRSSTTRSAAPTPVRVRTTPERSVRGLLSLTGSRAVNAGLKISS
jgi:hypothetical protein